MNGLQLHVVKYTKKKEKNWTKERLKLISANSCGISKGIDCFSLRDLFTVTHFSRAEFITCLQFSFARITQFSHCQYTGSPILLAFTFTVSYNILSLPPWRGSHVTCLTLLNAFSLEVIFPQPLISILLDKARTTWPKLLSSAADWDWNITPPFN